VQARTWHHGAFSKRVREHFQRRRVELFLLLMQPHDGVSIVDIGGGDGTFLGRVARHVTGRFVVADVGEDHVESIKARKFEFVRLREDGGFPFDEGEFDIVLCNSVIEHVTLPKSDCIRPMDINEWTSRAWCNQQRFAQELRRIGRRYFVQTPHRHFPIESHTWLPAVNYLNHNQTARLVEWTNRYWVKPCDCADWNLLAAPEMQTLFPDATIHVERLAGLPKSIVAYR
jgi:SAM-dependent methyltransferase